MKTGPAYRATVSADDVDVTAIDAIIIFLKNSAINNNNKYNNWNNDAGECNCKSKRNNS